MKKPFFSFSSSIEGWRLWVVYVLIAVIFLFYAYRLFSLQILDGAEYLAEAAENRTTRISIPALRGIIYDRNGVVLARNMPSFNVTITPAYLPALLPLTVEEPVAAGIEQIYRVLSELTGIPVSNGTVDENTIFKPCDTPLGIKQIVYIGDSNAPYDPVRVACGLSESVARTIRERAADLPGVAIEIEPVREYPTGELTAELIGFLGPVPGLAEDYYRQKGLVPGRDKVGYAGLENSMQDVLGGTNGERYVEVDVAGKELRDLTPPVAAVPGNNLRLTIDIRLQSVARDALISEMNYWNQVSGFETMNTGAVIAMDPRTGEILALVSYPSYENNRMARGIPGDYYEQLAEDPRTPLVNWAISPELPPGSVFKMPTAIGALNERVVAPEFQVDDPGLITIEQKPLPNSIPTTFDYVCWNRLGHGQVDWLTGVKESCDVYFYKIGGGFPGQIENGGLGIWRLGEYARALGYGVRTGIELPGETNGLIPDPTWKRIYQGESWTLGDTYIASMGQSFVLSTPLQVLVSAATLAADGQYFRPTLIHDVLNAEGAAVRPFTPDLKWDVTKDPVIQAFDENNIPIPGELKTIEPWVIDLAHEAMRLVVTEGTAKVPFADETMNAAGKTGSAEYCDKPSYDAGKCNRGTWPTHAWYFGYAPYDDPEIAVVAFVYNGGEGAKVSAPIVRTVMEAYFALKATGTP